MARLTLTDFDEWLDGAVQTDVEDVYALHEAGLKECSVSATIPTGSAKNSESLAEAHESDLLKLIHGSPTVPEDAQLKRLLKDVERLNFWQAHDWYVGERTLNGEWRFFDADGNSCKGASLREALDQLKVIQPDLRGQMSDDDAWED